MTTKQTTQFLIMLAVQIAVILAIVVFKISVVSGGQDVFIPIEPVDPRDPLRGDYVTFNLEISRIDRHYLNINTEPYLDFNNETTPAVTTVPATPGNIEEIPTKEVPEDSPIKEGQTIYVVLREAGALSRISYATLDKPSADQIFIKGQIVRVGSNEINVKYGIEEYFIPEGSGQISFWGREVVAHARVDSDGNAVLRGLLIDGKKWP